MNCVAWILQLCPLSGPVMKQQTLVSSQNNTTPDDSACNWTEKGNNRQKQLSTALSVKLQPSGLSSPRALCCEPRLPLNPSSPSPNCAVTYCHEKNDLFSPVLVLLQIFMFCLWAWFISMFWGLNSRFGNVLLHSATAARFWGSDSTSLDVAVVIRAVRLGHIHLPQGVIHVVHPVLAGWHAFVDAVEALGLLKAGNLVLGGEPTDGWKEKTHVKVSGSPCSGAV